MTPGCKDKGIKKSEFVAKTQFLYIKTRVKNKDLKKIINHFFYKSTKKIK